MQGSIFVPLFQLKVPTRLGGQPICPDPYAHAYPACPDATPLTPIDTYKQTNSAFLQLLTYLPHNIFFISPFKYIMARAAPKRRTSHNLASRLPQHRSSVQWFSTFFSPGPHYGPSASLTGRTHLI